MTSTDLADAHFKKGYYAAAPCTMPLLKGLVEILCKKLVRY